MQSVRYLKQRVALAIIASGALGSAAWAGPGDHIQAGPVEIVPSIMVGAEIRNNVFLTEKQPTLGGTFVFQPGLRLRVKTRPVNFLLDGKYDLRKYFDPVLAPKLDQFGNFKVLARLDLFPEAVVGFTLQDKASGNSRENDQAFKNNALITQIRNELSAGLPIRPGSDVTIEPGFAWSHQIFRIPGLVEQLDFNNRNTYGPNLDLEWRFFPNTSFVVNAHYDFNRWDQNWVPTNDPLLAGGGTPGEVRGFGEFLAKPDSDHFKGTAGMRGRITKIFLLDLEVGYGFGNYDDESVADESALDPGLGDEADPTAAGFGQDVTLTDAILLHVRPRFDLGFSEQRTFGQRITVQYRKDFQDSFFTNYVHSHSVLGGLESLWGRYLRTRVQGGARFEDYVGEEDRADIFTQLEGVVTVLPIRALPIDLGVAWQTRMSSDPTVEYDSIVGRVNVTFVY